MELGTIIITGKTGRKNTGHALRVNGRHTATDYPIALWDVLGQSILQRLIDRLRRFGVQHISIAHGDLVGSSFHSAYSDDDATSSPDAAGTSWEKALMEYAGSGVDQILLIRLGTYAELDLEDLIRFHRHRGLPLTDVSDREGPLGIALLDGKYALHGWRALGKLLPASSPRLSRYICSGYVNRLSSPADYRQLVQCALAGICELKPVGQEVKPAVWFGDGVRLHRSVRVLGPAYIGAHAKIRWGALIAPGTAVERRCEIDCGTVVENSTLLPRTYLGPGLHLSQAVVNGGRLIHLGRNLEVELGDTGLLRPTGYRTPLHIVEALGAMFGAAFTSDPGLELSTPSQAPATLDCVRSNGFLG